MSKNKLIFWSAFIVFVGFTVSALWNELARNATKLDYSISGVILSANGVGGGIIKTDNAHVLLFDPKTLELVASQIINPFLPPLTFSVGQDDTSLPLKGAYRLLVLTDKDGNPNRSSPGEVIGQLTPSIPLGTERIEYYMDRPFIRLPAELLAFSKNSPKTSIQGIITVHPNLLNKVDSEDRLVIMLFDPKKGRPVAIKILEKFNFPQKFRIGQSNAIGGQTLSGKYSLRILTDKNNQPYKSTPGEIVGRSQDLISLGVNNLEFVLDQLYLR